MKFVKALHWAVTSCFILCLLKQSGGFPGDETFSHGDDSTDAWVHTLIGNQSQQENRVKELMDLLRQRNYTFGKMPSTPDGGPLTVFLSVYVNRLVDIDEEEMVFTCDIYLRQVWHDPDFDFGGIIDQHVIYVPDYIQPSIWTPDTFIQNSKQAIEHTTTQPNRGLFVYGNGTLFYSNRLTLIVWCNIYLQDFPMDKQSCQIRFMTYRYPVQRMRYEWLHFQDYNSDLVINDLPMALFTLTDSSTGDCTTSYITGTFSCKMAIFDLQRQYGYYVTQIYVPSTLIVFMSWVTFWLSPDCSPARISLGIITLMTMAGQVGSTAGSSLPKVTYVKYIDIWVTACTAFLVSAITEYAIVYTLWWRPIEQLYRRREKEDKCKQQSSVVEANTITNKMASRLASSNSYDFIFKAPRHTSIMLDKICRILFPVLFALFNLIYWFHPVVNSRGPVDRFAL